MAIIGVCVDGSEQGWNAFEWCLNNLYKSGDELIVLHVTEYSLSVGVVPNAEALGRIVKEKEESVEALKGKITDLLKQKGVPGKFVRSSGKAGEAIINAVKSENITSLVVGTRGLGAIKRTLIGSVSEYVVRHSDIPVTVVPL